MIKDGQGHHLPYKLTFLSDPYLVHTYKTLFLVTYTSAVEITTLHFSQLKSQQSIFFLIYKWAQ